MQNQPINGEFFIFLEILLFKSGVFFTNFVLLKIRLEIHGEILV